MKPILEISGVSKKYLLKHEHPSYLSIRDSLSSFFKGSSPASTEEFWALKDVSFNVNAGDSIGIIGRNGAGKSTLLKILSKITPPSAGKIITRGRIASLLEVGTGFHAELTGKENVFLNGSILGMKRKTIQSKFDEIVDFSGVEKFLDTPLKHFSSGMQLRLAFAVAAFLDPEVLIIDEVLAVGDAEFQKKCFGKMEDVTKREGRTVLFVSHNLPYVQLLCPKSVLLHNGQLKRYESTASVVNEYLQSTRSSDHSISLNHSAPRKDSIFSFTSIRISSDNKTEIWEGKEILLELHFRASQPVKSFQVGFTLSDNMNHMLIESRSNENGTLISIGQPGDYRCIISLKPNLKAGHYSLSIGARSHLGLLEYIPSVAQFEILPIHSEKPLSDITGGVVLAQAGWEISKKV